MQTQQTPQVLEQPFAAQGDKNTIPNAATGTNKASLQEGFPPITEQPINQGGRPPERQDFNGAMNLNSQFYFAFQNGWWPTFTQEVSDAIGGYPQGAVLWLFDTENNVYTPLLSLVGNNTYNFNTNQDYIGQYWAKILPDSGRGLPLGAIYFSSSSNEDDNPGALPLWSGAYYTNAATLYPAFYAWVKSHTELCKSKTEYDAAISTYGECPYYVVDEVAGSLRLPKLVNYLKMANATDGITQAQAGLPNITGNFSPMAWSDYTRPSGAFTNGGTSTSYNADGNWDSGVSLNFNASRSSSIYGKSSTVTPAHTTLYPWVVVTASDAESSATAAAQSADAAATSASNASNSAEAAAQSATEAAQSAQEAASSANLADIQNKITNCITKIPQDIKFELSSEGTLTLKAGSKAWYPNGKDSDGALLFGSAVTANDISWTIPDNANYENLFVFLGGNRTAAAFRPADSTHSGSADPGTTDTTYYNISDNYIDAHNTAGLDRGLTFPLAIVKVEAGKVTQIKQVFNGFGYIGQVLFALPGVEGLSPNGRNEDGSLKNELMVLDHVVTRDFIWNCADGQHVFLGISQEYGDDWALISTGAPRSYKQQNEPPNLQDYTTWFCLSENKLYRTEDLSVTPNWVHMRGFSVGPVFNSGEGTNVSSWTIANPIAAVDMSNTSYLSKMAMPSNRYIDLTLGATGATYTAPANGYFCIHANGNGSNNWIEMINNSASSFARGLYGTITWQFKNALEAKSGDIVSIKYSNINTPAVFRFIYAEGEK